MPKAGSCYRWALCQRRDLGLLLKVGSEVGSLSRWTLATGGLLLRSGLLGLVGSC